jgi:hypothetical protein
VNIGARHAAVHDVAKNGDVPVFETALAVSDGEGIEQRLRGMLVHAVPGIEDRHVHALGDEGGGAGGGVTNHEAIRPHGFERADGIDERFALLQARRLGLQGHAIGAQPRRSGGEADPRARGRLEKRQGDGFAAQGGQFFERVTLEFLKWLGLIENKKYLGLGESFNSEQV